MFTTRLIATSEDLAALEGPWNALADGVPLRSWTWLATWWKHYGGASAGPRSADRQLRVVAAYKSVDHSNELVGVAP